jgi:hypothetical protein
MEFSSIAVVSQVFEDNKSLKNKQNDKSKIMIPTKASTWNKDMLIVYEVILKIIMENIK